MISTVEPAKWGFSDRLLGYDDSTTTSWSSHTDRVTLTIVSGSQYASFHRFDYRTFTDENLGSVMSTIGDSAFMNVRYHYFSLVVDGARLDTTAKWVVVEAESNGITKTDSIEILPPPVVTVTPSEISPGDTAMINVKTRNFDGRLINYPPDQYFEVGIWSGENYGTILSSGGSTEGYFGNIQQPFRFIAFDIDSDSVKVGIRVGTTTDDY